MARKKAEPLIPAPAPAKVKRVRKAPKPAPDPRVKVLADLLRSLQWSRPELVHTHAMPTCPSCAGFQPTSLTLQLVADWGRIGHANGCELAAALKGAP